MMKSRFGLCLPGQEHKINRREFLHRSMSFTAYLSLAQMIPRIAKAQSFTVNKNLVWISLNGGWDILEATDPKPESTSGIDMVYNWNQAHKLGSSDTVRIGRHLPKLASHGDDIVVVRGLAMGTTSHDAGSVYMDTGVLSNAGNVNAASIPAIVASESSATIPIIQLDGGMEPLTDRGLLNPVSVVRAQNLELYRTLYPQSAAEKTMRVEMLDYLNESVRNLEAKIGANDRLSSISDAESKIRTQIQADVGSKLSLTGAESAVYTNGAPSTNFDTNMAEAFALTAKLLKNNLVSCVNLGMGGYDTHANQDPQIEVRLTNLDFILDKFIEDLRNAGKLDSTLIVLYSDFGRTPKVNNSNGRDHWPVGGAMMIGGGIDGGRAVGATDSNLLAKNINFSTGLESSGGEQLNPTHLGGSILELTLGSSYLTYRSYLESISALTRLKT